MLVLEREVDEVIRIGDDITVMVVDIRGDRVRLGIAAPRGTSIHREEVYKMLHPDDPPRIPNPQSPIPSPATEAAADEP